jgi:glutathione S-transferase
MAHLNQLLENEVFMAFTSYATIILTKMMFMSTATAFYRLKRKVRNLEVKFSHFEEI